MLQDFIVYGISWMAVGAVILWCVKRWLKPPSEVTLVANAVWAVIGYFVSQNLPALEELWPAMPVFLPQILMAVLIFGGVLGYQPGEIAGRFMRWVAQRLPSRKKL